MSEEEMIEPLKEFDKKRIENLHENSRKLFNIIMEMLDKKDLYYKTLLDVKEHCNNAKYILEIINKALDDNE